MSFGVLRSAMHGKVLDVFQGKGEEGTKVTMWSQNVPPSPNQTWVLEPVGDGEWFYITSALDRNLVIDVPASKAEPGTHLHIWSKNHPTSKNQIWRWHNGALMTALGGNLVIDIKASNHEDEAEVILWEFGNTVNQKWDHQRSF